MPTPTDPFKEGHLTRYSDSSLYDEICVKCGATDSRHVNRLANPHCPLPLFPHHLVTSNLVSPLKVGEELGPIGAYTAFVWEARRYWTFVDLQDRDRVRDYAERVEADLL